MGFSKSLGVFFLKVVFFKKGASLVFSFITSYLVTVSTTGLFNLLIKDADKKLLILPFLFQMFQMGIYTLLTIIDYNFGKRVSIQVKKELYDPNKLLDTFVKYLATGIFTCMLMGMSIGGELIDYSSIWFTALIFQNAFWIMSNGYEYSSIGRHFKEMRGYKPNIFIFWDKAINIIEFGFLKNLDKSMPILPKEEKEIEKTEENEN